MACAFTHGRVVATCTANKAQIRGFLIKHPGLVLNKRTPAAGLSSAACVEQDGRDDPQGLPHTTSLTPPPPRQTEEPTLTHRAAGDVRVKVYPHHPPGSGGRRLQDARRMKFA